MRIRITSLRPPRFDELGLRRAMAGYTLPLLTAVMAFVAALAIAGWVGASGLIGRWDSGAGATLTVQVPRAGEPDATGNGTRLAGVQGLLTAAPGVTSVKVLSDEQLDALLRPWLGADVKNLAVPVPAVIAVHMAGEPKDLDGLAARLAQNAPGTIIEDHVVWAGRLGSLARSLRRCSGLVLLVVALVTTAVIAAATRSGLLARRDAIMIVSQLGATDGYIVRRFAAHTAALGCIGGAIGGLCALPVLFALTILAAPLAERGVPPLTESAIFTFLPPRLWVLPVILPATAGIIGYLTTQITVRRWLRRLP